MNIAFASIYGKTYDRDRLFDESSCNIGENLLVPGIALKTELEKDGNAYHTADMYSSFSDIDYIIIQDLADSYWLSCSSLKGKVRYFLKKGWKNDYLSFAIKSIPIDNRLLILYEPPVIAPNSYKKKNHIYFNKILTWDDDLVDNKKYFKFCYPQPIPSHYYCVPFSKKKFLTMICGNKQSTHSNELYSARKEFIKLCEHNKTEFDLFGYGWEKEHLSCYKGSCKNKLETLSHYKYSICYENMFNYSGYITEKIFDCFFAGSVPVYLGANNVSDYIPSGCFIDRRMFSTDQEVIEYINRISETEYNYYLKNAQLFLKSKSFSDLFSVDAYIKTIKSFLR